MESTVSLLQALSSAAYISSRKFYYPLLGAFAKLQKSTISIVMSAVCLSVPPGGTTRLPQKDFRGILYFTIFRNFVGKIQGSLKSETKM
jgi:hypothetical protein